MAIGNVLRQGLEEAMLVVLLGFEDVPVALCLLAHLSGNEFCEGIERTLLVEVPAGILLDNGLDDVVESGLLVGLDPETFT